MIKNLLFLCAFAPFFVISMDNVPLHNEHYVYKHEVCIRTDNQDFQYNIDANKTIGDLKEMFAKDHHISSDSFYLCHCTYDESCCGLLKKTYLAPISNDYTICDASKGWPIDTVAYCPKDSPLLDHWRKERALYAKRLKRR